MSSNPAIPALRVALPKGRMQEGVFRLLEEAGIRVASGSRSYRPTLSLIGLDAKILKPQTIVQMLHIGSRDLGFAGADWVAELDGGCVEILDTGLDPVRLVAAAPEEILVDGRLPKRPIVVASEYENLTRNWIERSGLDARFVRSHGATEVFPPDDADCIVDNSATGATLLANGLDILDTLMQSSTRLYASPSALADRLRRQAIERFALLVSGVLEARNRVMLEVNVPANRLEAVCAALPCMREPTVSTLHGGAGYAVKAAVPRTDLAGVIPELKARGATDIVVFSPSQIVP
jgi:ATP phosphoribosyltransferase